MKCKILYVGILSILASSLSASLSGYLHLSPVSFDKGHPTFTNVEIMKVGIGIGPVVFGTHLVGYKTMPNSHWPYVELFPLKMHFILFDSKRTNLYGYVHYSPDGEAELFDENKGWSSWSSMWYYSFGLGATLYYSLRFRVGYFNSSSSKAPDILSCNAIYGTVGIGLPDFYGKCDWGDVAKKGFKKPYVAVLTTVGGAIICPVLGFIAFDVFNKIGEHKSKLSPDASAFPILFGGPFVGAFIGGLAGLYWTASRE